MTTPADRQAAEAWATGQVPQQIVEGLLPLHIAKNAHLAGQAHGRVAGVMEGLEAAMRIIAPWEDWRYVQRNLSGEEVSVVPTSVDWAASRFISDIEAELARLRKEDV